MACPPQVILPEVHLDSPIVENKLLYLLFVGNLPLPEATYGNDPFPNCNWTRIRNEESRLSDRLGSVRDRLYSKILSRCQKKRNKTLLNTTTANVVMWPRSLPLLSTINADPHLERFKETELYIQRALQLSSQALNRLLVEVSYKLTGRVDLLDHNKFSCSQHQSHSRPNSVEDIGKIYQASIWTKPFYLWFLIRYLMRQQIMLLSDPSQTIQPVELDGREHSIIITPELVTIWLSEGNTVMYFTFEMTLMVCDLFEGRLNVSTMCAMSCYLYPLSGRLGRLIDIVDELCFIVGSSVYSIIANLESLVYAVLQLADPVPDLKGEFYSFICSEIIEILVSSQQFTLHEAEIVLSKLTECYLGLSPDLTAELLCIMRMWGHPMLTSEKAAEKVRESMCAPKVIDLQTNLKTLAFFNGIIINGFRRKHNGIWPKCKLPPNSSLSLLELKHDNSELSYSYILSHWKELAFLEFEKSLDADPGEDLSIFMKDKAISAPKKSWMSVFRRSLIKQLCEDLKAPLPEPYNRRLLLNFLSDDKFDPAKELEYVTTGEYLDDEEFCASYSLKEKEIKETGRIFAKLTKRMRSCQVISESMLASHVGKLFKENGVVLDQLSITKTLLTMSQIGLISEQSRRRTRENINVINAGSGLSPSSPTKPVKLDEKNEITACFLTTDLSKYCLNWRYQSIIMFATSLNKLYGYDHLFEWIHLRLMRSTLYVGDPFNPPKGITSANLDDILNDGIFIVSPRGGIEGLCQKLWTMISIAVIILSATEANSRVMSLVQGDNQAMAITTKVPRTLPHSQKKDIAHKNSALFIERLRANNFGMGHHLKQQETIVSSCFFVYSKRIIWRGRILNQSLKNASKLCMIADVLSECTQTSCSNLSTTVMRLAENGIEKDICYLLSHYLSVRQLYFDLMFPLAKRFEDDTTTLYLNHPVLVSRICILPSQLGGLNYFSLARLFNRNIGDPLTSALADMKRFIRVKLLPKWVLKNILTRKPGSGGWNTLAADPYALNIEYLYPPTSYLKKHTQRVLMESSINPMLRGIFSDKNAEDELSLAKFLLDRPIVMPRVAHIILEQTSCGRKKQIQGFLDTTRTIIRHALHQSPLSVTKTCKILEYNTLFLSYNLEILLKPHLIQQSSTSVAAILDSCSIDIAKTLRRLSWASLLNGRSLDGLETPDPLELVRGTLLFGSRSCISCMEGDRKYTWLFLPAGIEIDSDPEANPPIRVPYVGSRTDERRVASMGYVKGASNALKAALRLAGVYIWAFGDTEENWEQALELANTRTTLTMSQLRLLTPLPTSANLTHRLDDGLTQQKFTPASSYSFSSYVHISNDNQNLEILEKLQDSNLIYQQLMLLGLGIIETWLQVPNHSNPTDITIHLHTEAACCVKQVEGCIINESIWDVPILSIPYTNRFVYDPNPLDLHQQEKMISLEFQANVNGIDTVPPQDRTILLAHLVGLQFAHSLTGLDESTSLMNDAVIETDYANNWISECLNTYIDSVFIFTAWNILLDMSYQMYYLRIQGPSAVLDYLTLVLTRIPGLALTGISSTISHQRILRRLINLGVVRPYNSPYLATLDYHKLACDAIIWGARRVINMISEGIDIEIIIPSEDTMDISDRILNLVARKLTLITLVHCINRDLPYVRGLPPDAKCKVLTDFLLADISVSSQDESFCNNFYHMVTAPKLSAFPSNLYYLSRKLLNWVRDTDSAQQQLGEYYENTGLLDQLGNFCLQDLFNDSSSDPSTLTVHDFTLVILDTAQQTGTHHYPRSSDPHSLSVPLIPPPLDHHILRPVGLSSTSWYKGLSIVNVLDQFKIPVGSHLYLAEGSGAFMTLIESKYPSSTIYYNSYFSSGQNPPQRNFQPLPTQFTESLIYQNIRTDNDLHVTEGVQFIPLWSGNSKQTDLNDIDCVNYILSKIPMQSVSVVSLDLENSSQMLSTELPSSIIHLSLISSVLMKRDGVMILKTYLTPFPRFSKIITLLSIQFPRLWLTRSSYSDPNADEVYVLGTLVYSSSTDEISKQVQLASHLDADGFTLISENILSEVHEALLSQQRQIRKLIDIQLGIGRCEENLGDHILLSQLGTCSQTNKILDINPEDNFQSLLGHLSAILTTFIREAIIFLENINYDKSKLLFTSYNLDFQGKLFHTGTVTARQVLDHAIRNWSILPVASKNVLIHELELGSFRVAAIMSAAQYMRSSPIKKYIKQALGESWLNWLFDTILQFQPTRPQQKQIWKALGGVILETTLLGTDWQVTEADYFDDDSPEFDIFGDEI